MTCWRGWGDDSLSDGSGLVLFLLAPCLRNVQAEEGRAATAFERLAIVSSGGSGGGPSIFRWEENIRVGYFAVPPLVRLVIDKISGEIAKTVSIQIESDAPRKNFIFVGARPGDEVVNRYGKALRPLFATDDSFNSFFLKPFGANESCRGHIGTSGNDPVRIVGSVFLVDVGAGVDDLTDCIADGFVLSLGLLNPRAGGDLLTMFRVPSVKQPFILRDDLLALQVLYSDALRSGMSEGEVLSVIKSRNFHLPN
ncbi:MAG: DUF2927 domain-containing protein [Magnetospirillum sp.]|nr:MAG: DUF2927 domain-containing protein [Magnetospirillum sp.]